MSDLFRGVCSAACLLAVIFVALATPAWGLTASNVLVLYNAASPAGSEIASYYAQIHPGVRLLALQNVPTGEETTWEVYLNTIRPQVLPALNGSTDCIVTTKGLPLRISNPKNGGSPWSVYSSLESELTRVDSINSRSLMGNQSWIFGNPLAYNPYYLMDGPFSSSAYGTRLAARLDGFTVADVKASLDRAGKARIGWAGDWFVLDDDANAPASGADRMESLRDTVLAPGGAKYVYDGTDAFVSDVPSGQVLGYVGHGTNGGAPAGYISDPVNGLKFSIDAGAVFHTWESYNAYSFVQGGNHGGQGLVAEWLSRGGTAAVGHVEEPGASSTNVTNEDRMFQMLMAGYTWGEAAWNATNQLSFVNTVVGDPLMVWRPWLPGDATGDGRVDIADLAILSVNYGTDGKTKWQGDFNGDGWVDIADMGMLGANYGKTMGGAGASSVPEPASATVWLLLAWGLFRRKGPRKA